MLPAMHRLLAGSAVALTAAFLSCGDAGSGAETPASSSDVAATCQAMCDHDTRCGGSSASDCVATCEARQGNPANLSRQVLEILAACYRDPACLDDDTCEESTSEHEATVPGMGLPE